MSRVEWGHDDLAARARNVAKGLRELGEKERLEEVKRERDPMRYAQKDVLYAMVKGEEPHVTAECISGMPEDLQARGVRYPMATGKDERQAMRRLHMAFCTLMMRAKVGDWDACKRRAREASFVVAGRT